LTTSSSGQSLELRPEPQRGLLPRLWRRRYSIATFLILGGFAFSAVLRTHSEWTEVFIEAARALLHGLDFYAVVHDFTYPPFTAFSMIPFAGPNPFLARGIWYGCCVFSILYLTTKSWRLSGGPRIEAGSDHPAASKEEQAAFLLGHAVVLLPFLLNALSHLQTDILIAALVMAGCGAIVSRRFLVGATWIGVATAFKATPLLFAPYLIWRRQYLAGIWLFLVAILASLGADLVHRPPDGGIWLTRWAKLYVTPMGKSDFMPGDWKNDLNNNQAIAGAVRRWMTTSPTEDPLDRRPFANRMSPAIAAKIRYMFIGGCALMTLIPLAAVQWRRYGTLIPLRKSLRPDDLDSDSKLPSLAILEMGLICSLMLLLSPNSSRAHFCLLYLPAFSIARWAILRKDVAVRIFFALAVLSSVLSTRPRLPHSDRIEQPLLYLGVSMFAAVFLVFAATAAVRNRRVKSPYR
jgi:hypothetical protein